jgi:hypothetical protein
MEATRRNPLIFQGSIATATTTVFVQRGHQNAHSRRADYTPVHVLISVVKT